MVVMVSELVQFLNGLV